MLLLAVGVTRAESRVVSAYCSPTGDYCHGVFKNDRGVFLGISTFSFRGRYTLCARHVASGLRECHRFPLRERDGVYRSRISFNRQFTQHSRGRWCASWRKFGSKLGRSNCFHYRGQTEPLPPEH